jgi:hypothetical protein
MSQTTGAKLTELIAITAQGLMEWKDAIASYPRPDPILQIVGQVLTGLVGWHHDPKNISDEEIQTNIRTAFRYAYAAVADRKNASGQLTEAFPAGAVSNITGMLQEPKSEGAAPADA